MFNDTMLAELESLGVGNEAGTLLPNTEPPLARRHVLEFAVDQIVDWLGTLLGEILLSLKSGLVVDLFLLAVRLSAGVGGLLARQEVLGFLLLPDLCFCFADRAALYRQTAGIPMLSHPNRWHRVLDARIIQTE